MQFIALTRHIRVSVHFRVPVLRHQRDTKLKTRESMISVVRTGTGTGVVFGCKFEFWCTPARCPAGVSDLAGLFALGVQFQVRLTDKPICSRKAYS